MVRRSSAAVINLRDDRYGVFVDVDVEHRSGRDDVGRAASDDQRFIERRCFSRGAVGRHRGGGKSGWHGDADWQPTECHRGRYFGSGSADQPAGVDALWRAVYGAFAGDWLRLIGGAIPRSYDFGADAGSCRGAHSRSTVVGGGGDIQPHGHGLDDRAVAWHCGAGGRGLGCRSVFWFWSAFGQRFITHRLVDTHFNRRRFGLGSIITTFWMYSVDGPGDRLERLAVVAQSRRVGRGRRVNVRRYEQHRNGDDDHSARVCTRSIASNARTRRPWLFFRHALCHQHATECIGLWRRLEGQRSTAARRGIYGTWLRGRGVGWAVDSALMWLATNMYMLVNG